MDPAMKQEFAALLAKWEQKTNKMYRVQFIDFAGYKIDEIGDFGSRQQQVQLFLDEHPTDFDRHMADDVKIKIVSEFRTLHGKVYPSFTEAKAALMKYSPIKIGKQEWDIALRMDSDSSSIWFSGGSLGSAGGEIMQTVGHWEFYSPPVSAPLDRNTTM